MLFISDSEKNKFGYYQVGPTFKSYSRFEALEYKELYGGDVQWVFNDDFFSAIDWTVEPTETLEELYAQRAQQLRDKYDYLVLYFSGGADSHNILNAFAQNKIHIDEVISFHTYDLTNDSKFAKTDHIGEIFGAAVPEFEKLKHLLPNTVHTVLDISDLSKSVLNQIEITDYKFNFVYDRNNYFGPTALARDKISQLPKYLKLYEQGRTVGFIHGLEKPKIYFDKREWHFCFWSIVDSVTSIPRRQHSNNKWEQDELFYWDPSAWKIIAKQCHSVRNYIKLNSDQIKSWPPSDDYTNGIKNIEPSTLEILGKMMPIEVLKQIIYPWWRPDILNFGKMHYKSTLLGNMNQWYLNASTNLTPGAESHIAGIKKFVNYMGHNAESSETMRPYMHSKFYKF